MDWGSIVLGLATSLLGGGIGVLVTLREMRRKARAEAVKTEAEASKLEAEAESQTLENAFRMMKAMAERQTILEQDQCKLRDDVSRLNRQLRAAHNYIEHLVGVIKKLNQQLSDLNQIPCAEPDPWHPEEDSR